MAARSSFNPQIPKLNLHRGTVFPVLDVPGRNCRIADVSLANGYWGIKLKCNCLPAHKMLSQTNDTAFWDFLQNF